MFCAIKGQLYRIKKRDDNNRVIASLQAGQKNFVVPCTDTDSVIVSIRYCQKFIFILQFCVSFD